MLPAAGRMFCVAAGRGFVQQCTAIDGDYLSIARTEAH
jgi:hypothetical protein